MRGHGDVGNMHDIWTQHRDTHRRMGRKGYHDIRRCIGNMKEA